MRRRPLTARLLPVLLALLLAGCAPSGGGDGTGAQTSAGWGFGTGVMVTEEPGPESEILLIEGGRAQFVLVCEEGDFLGIAEELQASLRKKTGVELELFRFQPDRTDGAHCIFVGDYWSRVRPEETPMPYDGYASVVGGDGNIYLCASTQERMTKCVQLFLSRLTASDVETDAEGKTVCRLPSAMFFTVRPDHPLAEVRLYGTPLREYRIVCSADAGPLEQAAALRLADTLLLQSGYALPVVTDETEAVTHEIVLGQTTRPAAQVGPLGETDYAVRGGTDGRITVQGGSYCALYGGMLALVEHCAGDVTEAFGLNGSVSAELEAERASPDDVRIMTRNCLFWDSDTLLTDHTMRAALTAETVNLYQPDFVGLQEADNIMMPLIRADLDGPYADLRDDLPGMAGVNYSILYRSDLWKFEEGGGERFSNDPSQAIWGYVWGRFSNLQTGKSILVMNLHYHYRSTEDRLPEVAVVNAALKSLMERFPALPVAVTGDYNCTIGSEEFGAMMQDLPNPMQSGVELTTDNDAGGYGIDHVSVTGKLATVVRHRVVSYEAFSEASDHKAVYVDLRLP